MADVRELDDLLYLIRCVLHRRKPEQARVQAMDLERLYQLSRYHSLAALTYTAVESAWDGHPPRDRLPAGWKEARDAAIRNSLLFTAERKALEQFCEKKEIWYLPLKGALLQNDYPALGLREMGDNDILFDTAHQQQIHDWFVSRGYQVEEYRQSNHDSYHKPPVLNFEMHTALFASSAYPVWADFFEAAVTERLCPVAGTRWGRCFTPEDFYLYLLAHMQKHFEGGGTGLRSLVDVYVFCRAHGNELDQTVLNRGLERLNLADFERENRALADRVFGCEGALNPEDAGMLTYYLTSGTYGTYNQQIQNWLREIAGENGTITGSTKLRYNLRRLFPERAYMERWCRHDAPFFLRHPRLMPLAYGYRFLLVFTRGRGKKFLSEQRFLWKQ